MPAAETGPATVAAAPEATVTAPPVPLAVSEPLLTIPAPLAVAITVPLVVVARTTAPLLPVAVSVAPLATFSSVLITALGLAAASVTELPLTEPRTDTPESAVPVVMVIASGLRIAVSNVTSCAATSATSPLALSVPATETCCAAKTSILFCRLPPSVFSTAPASIAIPLVLVPASLVVELPSRKSVSVTPRVVRTSAPPLNAPPEPKTMPLGLVSHTAMLLAPPLVALIKPSICDGLAVMTRLSTAYCLLVSLVM